MTVISEAKALMLDKLQAFNSEGNKTSTGKILNIFKVLVTYQKFTLLQK